MLVPRDCLVGREIHFAALYRFSLDLPACISKWRKSFVFRVVDEHIPVGEKEDTGPPMLPGAVPARVPELIADLKGDDRLARPRSKREKHPVLALQNGLHRAID